MGSEAEWTGRIPICGPQKRTEKKGRYEREVFSYIFYFIGEISSPEKSISRLEKFVGVVEFQIQSLGRKSKIFGSPGICVRNSDSSRMLFSVSKEELINYSVFHLPCLQFVANVIELNFTIEIICSV